MTDAKVALIRIPLWKLMAAVALIGCLLRSELLLLAGIMVYSLYPVAYALIVATGFKTRLQHHSIAFLRLAQITLYSVLLCWMVLVLMANLTTNNYGRFRWDIVAVRFLPVPVLLAGLVALLFPSLPDDVRDST